MKAKIAPLKAAREKLSILNQLKLPHITEYIECKNEDQVAESIAAMHVRGAPAIGIAAAYGFYLGIWQLVEQNKTITTAALTRIKKKLDKARPTAVNLAWATEKMQRATQLWLDNHDKKADKIELLLYLFNVAHEIQNDDADRCERMSTAAADFIEKKFQGRKIRILTHCNTGALATGGIGTALGVIRVLHSRKQVELVYVDETRPYLQGSRLTAYELQKERINQRLIVDSMAAYLMQQGEVDLVVTGADRITSRGDVANKIGTYSLSVAAKAHNIPFFVIAPESSFDLSLKHGSEIEIEERPAQEVTHVQDTAIAAGVKVLNYSFDITPVENITAIFHENGRFKPS